ncbi:MAG: hypothetical protein K1X79_03565 [Oligoflexia bacterium]|nr:hypothetical protein [Oligoflexia bacterium]
MTSIVVDTDVGQLAFLQIQAGKIYWSNYDNSKIKRANLDGSAIETLVSGADATSVEGVSYDSALDKLYFIGHPTGGISLHRSTLGGASVEVLGIETGFDVVANFFVADPTATPTPTATATASATATVTPTPTATVTNTGTPTPTATITNTPTTTSTPTLTVTPTATRTVTSTPTLTVTPTPTLSPIPTALINSGLFYSVYEPGTPTPGARASGIYYTDLSLTPIPVLVDTRTTNITAMASSIHQQRIYWSNKLKDSVGDQSAIYSARMDGSDVQILRNTFQIVLGMAVDQSRDILYYLEGDAYDEVSYGGYFARLNLSDGSMSYVGSALSIGRGIAYNPTADGLMYGSFAGDIRWLPYGYNNSSGNGYEFAVSPGSNFVGQTISISNVYPDSPAAIVASDHGYYVFDGLQSSTNFQRIFSRTSRAIGYYQATGARPLKGKVFNNSYLVLLSFSDGTVVTSSGVSVQLAPVGSYITSFAPSEVDYAEIVATSTPTPSGGSPITFGRVTVKNPPSNTFGGLLVTLAKITPTPSGSAAITLAGSNEPNDELPCGSTLSDANGNYSFSNLSPGEYTIYFDRLDVQPIVNQLNFTAGTELPPLLAEYSDPAPSGCTSKDKVKAVNAGNTKIASVIKYLNATAKSLSKTGKKKLSSSKAAAFSAKLSTYVEQQKSSYCSIVSSSLDLPEIPLSCASSAGCSVESHKASYKNILKKLNALQSQGQKMLNYASKNIPGLSVASQLGKLKTKVAAAVSKVSTLPYKTYSCPDSQ